MDPGNTTQCLALQQSPSNRLDKRPPELALGPQSPANPAGPPETGMPQNPGNQQQAEGNADATSVQQPEPAPSSPVLSEPQLQRASDKPRALRMASGWDRASPADAAMINHMQEPRVAQGVNPASAVTPRSSNWSLDDGSQPSLLAEQPPSKWLTPSSAGSLPPEDDLDALLVQVM